MPERAHDARRRRSAICASCSAVGIDVDGGVAEEDDVLLEHQHVHAADEPRLRMRADHLERRADRLGIVHVDARHERVGVAAGDHHGAEVVAVVHAAVRLVERQAFALPPLPQVLGVRARGRGDVAGSSMRDAVERDARLVARMLLDASRRCRAGSARRCPRRRRICAARMILRLLALGEHDALAGRDARD